MKLLLDTTYLLPFINVEVKGVDRKKVERALNNHHIQLSEIQLFELFAKGNVLEAKGLTTIEDIVEGVETLYHSLEVLPLVETDVLSNANLIYRSGLNDTIDAVILASALKFCEGLATLDEEIKKMYEKEQVKSLNPNLKIFRL